MSSQSCLTHPPQYPANNGLLAAPLSPNLCGPQTQGGSQASCNASSLFDSRGCNNRPRWMLKLLSDHRRTPKALIEPKARQIHSLSCLAKLELLSRAGAMSLLVHPSKCLYRAHAGATTESVMLWSAKMSTSYAVSVTMHTIAGATLNTL